MKSLILILSLLITNEGCDNTTQNEIIEIAYEASTRGSFVGIKITPDGLVYNDNTIEVSKKQWNKLVYLAQVLDLEELNSLEAPSQNRFRDAAMATVVKITTTEKAFTSSQFDHDNPPVKLVKLVNEILSLANIVDKE